MIYIPIAVFIAFGFIWLMRRPKLQPVINKVCFIITDTFLKDYKDEMISHCIKDYYSMLEQIKASTSEAEVESWFWEVDVFRNHYINLVPDALVYGHADRLEAECHRMRDQVKKFKWALTSPQIGLQ